MTEKLSRVAEDGRAKHCKKFQRLHKTQHPPLPSYNREPVVNLSEVPLEEPACSALSKGLNYAVTSAVVPVENILCGLEKAIGILPEETGKEVRQETIRILKGSRKPKDNLTVAERRAVRALKVNEALTILPDYKGSAAAALNTAGYHRKITALREDHAYRKLKNNPSESVEH
jgi:hypothetical protein